MGEPSSHSPQAAGNRRSSASETRAPHAEARSSVTGRVAWIALPWQSPNAISHRAARRDNSTVQSVLGEPPTGPPLLGPTGCGVYDIGETPSQLILIGRSSGSLSAVVITGSRHDCQPWKPDTRCRPL